MLLDADPAHAFLPYPPAEVAVAHAATGPLSGLTFGVKDLLDVAGYPTGAGSPHVLASSGVKARTAPVVQSLLEAGARFIGKTHTDELAFSLSGKNAHFGTPVNGAALDRIPGGSSSGSASAVSHGLCDFALGTDTGGSVRAPASHCGLFGIRPTHGRVNLEGGFALAPSFDACGYVSRDGETFVRVGEVLLGGDTAALPETPHLLLAADTFAMLGSEVRGALAPHVKAIEDRLGSARLVEAGNEGLEPLCLAFRHIQGREAWTAHGAMIEHHRLSLGPGIGERFAFARIVTDAQVAQAEATRARFRDRFVELFSSNSVMLLPTMPDIAPLLSESEDALNDYRNQALNLLCLAGLAGFPQVTMPLANRLGAPMGLSLIGPEGSDLSLVRLSAGLAEP